MDLTAKINEVDELSSKGNSQGAIRLLLDMIKECAALKQFQAAETLREKIFSIDDMALFDIVEAAEIIENAKSNSIPIPVRNLWVSLNRHFTETEYNALFYSMEERSLGANEIIYRQGDKNDSIYFVNEGKIKSIYAKSGEEILIQTLDPGSMFGHDTFFSFTLCTTTMMTMTPVKLGVLTDAAVQKIKDIHAGILPKLKNYSIRLEKPQESLKLNGATRRTHKRYKMDRRRIGFTITSPDGRPMTREHRGELSDVSRGGLSFYIRTSNRDQAKQLLGRNIKVNFELPTTQGAYAAERSGSITGVIAHMFSDYSVHVKFDKQLDPLSKLF